MTLAEAVAILEADDQPADAVGLLYQPWHGATWADELAVVRDYRVLGYLDEPGADTARVYYWTAGPCDVYDGAPEEVEG